MKHIFLLENPAEEVNKLLYKPDCKIKRQKDNASSQHKHSIDRKASHDT